MQIPVVSGLIYVSTQTSIDSMQSCAFVLLYKITRKKILETWLVTYPIPRFGIVYVVNFFYHFPSRLSDSFSVFSGIYQKTQNRSAEEGMVIRDQVTWIVLMWIKPLGNVRLYLPKEQGEQVKGSMVQFEPMVSYKRFNFPVLCLDISIQWWYPYKGTVPFWNLEKMRHLGGPSTLWKLRICDIVYFSSQWKQMWFTLMLSLTRTQQYGTTWFCTWIETVVSWEYAWRLSSSIYRNAGSSFFLVWILRLISGWTHSLSHPRMLDEISIRQSPLFLLVYIALPFCLLYT